MGEVNGEKAVDEGLFSVACVPFLDSEQEVPRVLRVMMAFGGSSADTAHRLLPDNHAVQSAVIAKYPNLSAHGPERERRGLKSAWNFFLRGVESALASRAGTRCELVSQVTALGWHHYYGQEWAAV